MNKALLRTLVIAALAGAAGVVHHLRQRSGSSGPLYHVRTAFSFTVHAPYGVTAPLFGPEGEKAWASDSWDPHFLYPHPAQDIEGAVFQIRHGHHRSTWVNTAFDLDAGHIHYVYVIPEVMVTRIDLHLSKPSADTTGVRVAYERTALSADANERVRNFGEADQKSGKVWGEDIEGYLAAQKLR